MLSLWFASNWLIIIRSRLAIAKLFPSTMSSGRIFSSAVYWLISCYRILSSTQTFTSPFKTNKNNNKINYLRLHKINCFCHIFHFLISIISRHRIVYFLFLDNFHELLEQNTIRKFREYILHFRQPSLKIKYIKFNSWFRIRATIVYL